MTRTIRKINADNLEVTDVSEEKNVVTKQQLLDWKNAAQTRLAEIEGMLDKLK